MIVRFVVLIGLLVTASMRAPAGLQAPGVAGSTAATATPATPQTSFAQADGEDAVLRSPGDRSWDHRFEPAQESSEEEPEEDGAPSVRTSRYVLRAAPRQGIGTADARRTKTVDVDTSAARAPPRS